MRNLTKTILTAVALSVGVTSYAFSGIVIAEETWDVGDGGFSLANEVGASGALTSQPATGNPAPSFQVDVDIPGTGIFTDRIGNSALGQWSGTYNVLGSEILSFDFFQNAEPSGLQFYLVGSGVEWFYDIDTSGFDDGPAWNSVNISMGSDAGWEDFGSSDFLADLSSVTEVGFRLTYLESTLGQVYAFDNLQRRYGTPEPETYAALSFALICLGFTFRRKIEGSMSSAMAMIKS